MKVLAKLSVTEYHRMVEADILRDCHVELLDGEIFEKSPKTPIYFTTVRRGTKYLEDLISGVAEARFN
ncbi:MAG: hypothetical protein AAGG02_08175 [Cyanobacteria bacterium P01_H01_bin.15]